MVDKCADTLLHPAQATRSGLQERHRKCLAVLAGMAVGTLVFLLLYGTSTLHVTNDGWILNGYDETDIQQHYAGWLAFRNAHWSFPLGRCDTLAWPDGTCISYTDSLPWVSIFFKLLRGILPGTFQFFGIYTLFCFAMQGAAGALLAGHTVLWHGKEPEKNRKSQAAAALDALPAWSFVLLVSLLFVCLPTMWERAFRHTALASQYLFLFALYFYLEYRADLWQVKQKKYPWQMVFLAFAAVGIHPYFLPPVLLCALLAAVELWRTGKRPLLAAGAFAVCLAAALAGGWITGALGSGVSASRYGYGEISMNLNAAFNPSSRGGYLWSRALPVLPQQAGQYDGFNYLGLGILLLTALALCLSTAKTMRRPAEAKAWWKRNCFLMAACVFLTAFAVTNRAWLGNIQVYAFPLPAWLARLCGIFRSSGRMFYLAAACLVLYGCLTLWQAGTKNKILCCCLLAGLAAVQCWDLSAAAAQKKAMFSVPINATVANSEQTQTLGSGHTKLLSADSALREDRLRLLAILAGKQGLATNLSIAVSGEYVQAQQSVETAAARLAAGEFDADTVYVTTDGDQYAQWQQTFETNPAVTLFVADSCYFLVPAAG
jgi:hypothetical protein